MRRCLGEFVSSGQPNWAEEIVALMTFKGDGNTLLTEARVKQILVSALKPE
ncbi:hypothetical protein [Leptolyngbya sp. BC1307]|uniref:hypothetical protein n=1 Tax=Leptolyngbya sp. BC1307 TaxID=2029589 RepID=UPI00148386D3|nr:hypothetical protein [Leptolyngbya sp. BC1307]